MTYANVMSTLAFMLALTGTAYAAGIGSGGIVDNSIQSRDIHNGTVASIDLANGGIGFTDLSMDARRRLAGAAGPAGAAGANGTNGAQGPQGVPGPQGQAGAAGTTIDSIMDLEGLACAPANGGPGTVDVIPAPNYINDTSSITLMCDFGFAPIACTDPEPSAAHTEFVCAPRLGDWYIESCELDWVDRNDTLGDGCEVERTEPAEWCDGVDNDGDLLVDFDDPDLTSWEVALGAEDLADDGGTCVSTLNCRAGYEPTALRDCSNVDPWRIGA